MADSYEIASAPQNDRQVSMSNRLARAAHGLNLPEKRLVALALANTDSVAMERLERAKNQGWKLKVTAHEYAEQFGVSTNTAYEQLKAASDALFERRVSYKIPKRRGEGHDTINLRWVSSAKYAPGDGYVELNFTPEIAPHLLGLRQHFTTYKLRWASHLDSVYAWRLHEFLRSWQDRGGCTIVIEEFWDVMEAPDSCRKDFKALRVRIIEPSVKAVEAHAGLLVTWEPIRAGSRRVTELKFTFGPNPQQSLAIDEPAADPVPISDTN